MTKLEYLVATLLLITSQCSNLAYSSSISIYKGKEQEFSEEWFKFSTQGCIESSTRRKRSLEDNTFIDQSPSRERIWDSNLLLYKVHGHPESLDDKQTRHAIYRAFRIWAKQSDFIFIETENDADINIRFESGEHGDGENQAFDGEGGHLAHALFPPEGEIHFDADEWWAVSGNRRTAASGYERDISQRPYSLVHVAAHEIGHALGLHHSRVINSLMYPIYQKDLRMRTGRITLDKSDIETLENLYSEDPTSSPSLKDPRTGTGKDLFLLDETLSLDMNDNPSRYMSHLPPRFYGRQKRVNLDAPNPCNCKIDASYYDNKILYLFSGRYYWAVNTDTGKRSKVRKIRTKWRLAKPKVHAATHSTFSNRTYLFSGHKYWRLYDGHVEPGYPRYVKDHGLPTSPDAASSVDYSPHIYIFKNGKYFVFNELAEVVMEDSKKVKELSIAMAPKSGDSPFDAMFTLNTTALHVVSGRTFTTFDAREIWPELKHRRLEQNIAKRFAEKYGIFGKMSPLNC